MIRPLRARHLRLVVSLAVVLPVLFAMGLRARKPAGALPLPGAVAGDLAPFATVLLDEPDLWPGLAIRTRAGLPSPGAVAVLELAALEPLRRPELLVYWTPQGEQPAGAPPEHSILLGAFLGDAPTRFPLPDGALGSGRVLLYSPAQGEMVSSCSLPAVAGAS